METGSIIIGIVLAAICIIPFVLVRQNKKRKEKQLLENLRNAAAEQQCLISSHEVLGQMAIGMDASRRFVFFINNNHNELLVRYVNLADYRSCRAVNSSKAVNSGDSHFRVIDKVELVFIPVVKTNPDTTWTFYNAEDSSHLYGELEFVEKWAGLINTLIKKK